MTTYPTNDRKGNPIRVTIPEDDELPSYYVTDSDEAEAGIVPQDAIPGLVEIVREAAGNMCYSPDSSILGDFNCGICTSCRARALIAKIDGEEAKT